jgi:hypothetical protein
MSRARPEPAEERWLALGGRYPALRAAAEKPVRTGGWKSATWLSRCLLFVLGVVAAGMAGGTFALLPVARLLVAGIALVALAEYLLARRRVLGPGLEEALYACGAAAIALQLALWIDGELVVGALLLSLALAGAGMRLLNPLFTSLAALLLSVGLALLGENAGQWQLSAWLGCLVSGVLGVAALGAAAYRFERPAHDRMVDGLILSMPVAASLWLLADDALLAVPVALLAGGACLVLGVRRRSHAPLFAALLQLPCLAWALHERVPIAVHWQLMAWGAALLSAALLVERVLGRPRAGLGAQRLEADPPGLEALQIAGVAMAAPGAAEPAAEQGVAGEGGRFGGGGATGQF